MGLGVSQTIMLVRMLHMYIYIINGNVQYFTEITGGLLSPLHHTNCFPSSWHGKTGARLLLGDKHHR